MSNLGDNLQDTIDALKSLSVGDDWRTEFESYVDDTKQQLNAAAPDSIRDSATGEITADVNNAVTQSQELSVTHNDEPGITREVVFKAEDTDTTTPLSFDAGALTTHDEFRVRATVGGHGGGGAMEVKGQINNLTDPQYDYVTIGDGTTGSTVDNAYWADEVWSTYQSTIDWAIRGAAGTASTTIGPTIRGNSTTSVITTSLLDHGVLSTNNEMPVESIQLFTDVNAVATVVIEGVNY